MVAAVGLFTVGAAQAAPPVPPNQHLETLDAAQAPANARGQSSSRAAVVTMGRFTSVQANVDSLGNNIVGDAANEPSIAVDPTDPNDMAIGWREFTSIASNFRQSGYAFTTDKGATWTFPGPVRPGEFASDPVLNADADGNLYYLSLQTGRGPVAWPCYMYKSFDGGQSWPQDVYAFGGDKAWFDIDRTNGPGRGNLYIAWSPNPNAGCCPPNTFTRSVDGGLTWMTPILVPGSQFSGTIAVAPDGAVYTIGSSIAGVQTFTVVRSSNAWDSGQTPDFDLVSTVNLDGIRAASGGPNPVGLLGQAQVVVDYSNGPTRGNLYVLSSVQRVSVSDPSDVMFARSTDRGLTWSAPVRVNDDSTGNGAYQWFGAISAAPNGRIDAIWNDTRNDATPNTPTFSELRYSWSLDGGSTWSPSDVVTPAFNHFLGYPQQNKLGDYYDMESDNSGADLAFAATFNGEQDVYYVRLTPDCNGNGVADATDIANAFSADCDGNLIPDECEPNLDCNSNTIQDICDIAASTSQDCNSNRIPDECEPNFDCNANQVQDICDVVSGLSTDCDADFILDLCELIDCNSNGLHDACDLLPVTGTSADCNANLIPDECDIASATSLDVNMDGVPDECLVGACCFCDQCSLLNEADCLAQQGNFQGVAVPCSPDLCLLPANDRCASAQMLPPDVLVTVPIDNRCATTDGPTPISCEAGAIPVGADLWYQYVAPCSGTATGSLCPGAPGFDTVLAVYGGGVDCACPASAPFLGCADDTCGMAGGPSTITGPMVAGGCYTIRVSGWLTSTGIEQFQLSVTCQFNPPTPADTVCVGGNVPGQPCGTHADCPNGLCRLKNRFLSLTPGGSGGAPLGIKTTLTALDANSVPTPGDYNGTARWVGPATVGISDGVGLPTYNAAKLHCAFHATDWSGLGSVNIYGDVIVPGSTYDVSVCLTETGPCSTALRIGTAKFGDVVAPVNTVNFSDVSSIVANFQGASTRPSRTRADMVGAVLNPTSPSAVNFSDVSACVAAFQGNPFKVVVPTPPATCP